MNNSITQELLQQACDEIRKIPSAKPKMYIPREIWELLKAKNPEVDFEKLKVDHKIVVFDPEEIDE